MKDGTGRGIKLLGLVAKWLISGLAEMGVAIRRRSKPICGVLCTL